MKHFNKILLFSLVVLFMCESCGTHEQSKTEAISASEPSNQQISLIQNSLDALVQNIYGNTSIKTDTAPTLVRLDSMAEKDKATETTKFRLGVIEESIRNLSQAVANKSSFGTGCRWVIVGWYSCSPCTAEPNGTVHCSLCPIKKWVCDGKTNQESQIIKSEQSDTIASSAGQNELFLSADKKTVKNKAGVIVAKLTEVYEAVAPDVNKSDACPASQSWTCI